MSQLRRSGSQGRGAPLFSTAPVVPPSSESLELRVQRLATTAATRHAAERRAELAARHAAGELVRWPESARGIPNELVRCAIFAARNRRDPRRVYRADAPMLVPILGGGKVAYIGEELRQDDETVWMQLVHLAKQGCSEWVSFTPSSFIKAIGWPIKGASYTRLLTCLRRLASCGIEVYSQRFEAGVSTKLVVRYEYDKTHDRRWRVQVFDKDDHLFLLFDRLYSRVDWKMRLALPDGLAQWLHGFFSSHRHPYDHKIATLLAGAGLLVEPPHVDTIDQTRREKQRKERLREGKKTIRNALEALKGVGFLQSYEITRTGLVRVVRAA